MSVPTTLRRDVATTCSRPAPPTPARSPRPTPPGAGPGRILNDRGTLFLVAADHPARGALASGGDADGDGRPALAAGPAGRGAQPPRRRRRARHARRRRGAAAARRARGQGRHRLDEPGRPRRRHLDHGRPVHRLRRREHRRRAVSRAARCCSASTTPTPAPPRRSRAAREAVSELAGPRAGGDGRAAALPPRGGRIAAPAQGRAVAGPRGQRSRAGSARPAPTPG